MVVPTFAAAPALLLVVRMQLINRLARHRADEPAYRATHAPLTGPGSNRALPAGRLRDAPGGTLLPVAVSVAERLRAEGVGAGPATTWHPVENEARNLG